jgi:hypothetical protein
VKFVHALQILALLPFLALSYSAHAAPEETPWDSLVQEQAPQLLSTLSVTLQVTTFEVPIPNCGKTLHSVKLQIMGGDVNLTGFGLRFSDTRTLNIPKSQTYKAGTDSGWIDLSPFQRVPLLCPTAIYATGSSPTAATVIITGIMN